VICFAVTAYAVGNRPRSWVLVSVACVVGAFVQAVIEATTFLIRTDTGLSVAILDALGNTVTHGILLGAIPKILLIPLFYDRLERLLGYPPKEQEPTDERERTPERL
jgi:hypothetical protein